ncbi:MAG TPA: hypothetical protein PLJ30_14435, partial [Deltaproteobacteria bacterium]|nr:hypothetical protein [Deltaproteobacteria bacterium]
EPPEHVIFIMATTELAKVPVTVLSRCQRYDFRRIPVSEIIAHLSSIALQEHISITEDALMIIALQADGSMRDAQGMLEHVAAAQSGDVDARTVERMLGLVERTTMHDLLTGIIGRDVSSVLDVVGRVYQYGHDLLQLYRSLMESFRNMMVIKAGYANISLPQEEKEFLQEIVHGVPFEEVHRMLSVLIHSEEDVKFSSLPKVTIETVLLRIMSAPDLADIQQLIQAATARPVPAPARQAAQAPVAQEKYRKPISALPQSWDGFVSYLKDHDPPMYAMLTTASRTGESQDGVDLMCANQFVAEQIKKALPEIRKKAQIFFRRDIQIRILLQESPQQAERKPRPSEIRANVMKSPVVKEILSEFNGVVKDVKSGE